MSAVTDHTPALADLDPAGWTEPDMEAWSNEIADGEWRNAQLDPGRPSGVLAAEWEDGGDEITVPVDDSGPETVCEPNMFRFCRHCGRDMDTSSSGEGNGS